MQFVAELRQPGYGPVITDVQIANPTTGAPLNYNLFGVKGANGSNPGVSNFAQGPTPLVNSLLISVLDNPDRDTIDFPTGIGGNVVAIAADLAMQPGTYVIRGDHVGVEAITQIKVVNNPVVNGQPATATIQLIFAKPLPDDHYTLTINGANILDLAGNELSGWSNAAEPSGSPTFNGTGGQPGNFVAGFTVDSRPHLGIYGNGIQQLDINGDGVWDPNNNTEASNNDISTTFGLYTDMLFDGNLAPSGQSGTGFDELGAYGQVNGQFRWLLSFSGVDSQQYSVVSGLQINGLPVAGKFNPNINADEIGLFDGSGNWYIDFNHTNNITGSSLVLHTNMRGYPVVGDFDGSGNISLATYQPDTNTWQFDLDALTAHPVFTTLQWGFPGVLERPVAADMNGDGVTDIGLFVPVSLDSSKTPGANWYFLVSQGTPVTGTINTLNHAFNPQPFGSDLYYTFGNGYFQPLVGIWDPPTPTPKPVYQPVAGTFTNVSETAQIGSVAAGGYSGLAARASANGQNEYWGGIVNTGKGYEAEIAREINGTWQTLTTAALTSFYAGESVTFSVVGTTLDLSVNGTQVAAAADAALQSAGSVGSYYNQGSMMFTAQTTTLTRSVVALPFSDSFGQPNGALLNTNWDEWSGSFQTQNGTAVGQGATNLAALYNVAAANVTVSADILTVPLGGFAGLVSRYNTANGNMYRAGIAATYNAQKKTTIYTAQIWRRVNGVWKLLVSQNVTSLGQLSFVTAGSSLQLYLNGSLAASATDTALTIGTVGLYGTKSSQFSNFSAH